MHCLMKVNFSFILDKSKLLRVLTSALNVVHRNAGPTGDLTKKAQLQRNALIDDVVNFISFGDKKSEFFGSCAWPKCSYSR